MKRSTNNESIGASVPQGEAQTPSEASQRPSPWLLLLLGAAS
jgi:hypothetical protein